jgi:prolyl-tRNA synthetase
VYLSKLLGKTLRQPPSDAHLISHQLLTRAGCVRTLEGGLVAYLPLGHRALHSLQVLVRRELLALGALEIDLPLGSDVEPSATLVQLVRREIDSYRQLPLFLFEMAARSAPPSSRSRAGLFGASERHFVEIHAFGGDDLEGATDQVMTDLLDRVLAACQLPVMWAAAGSEGRRAYYLNPAGDESLLYCPDCGYAAERSWAATAWPEPPAEPELPPGEIETPDCNTIATLAEFLGILPSRTLKMVFYSVQGQVTCVVVRGDRAVDEDKLARLLGTDQYYASLEHELAAIGAVGGYASPIGLDRSRVRVVADPSVRSGKNLVSGANRPDYHLQNVNVPRDFVPGEWLDLARVEAGDPCPHCGIALQEAAVFALVENIRPTTAAGTEYLDQDGRGRLLWLTRWRLDLSRLLAAVVEVHHDQFGIIWPAACAPFDVHLVLLDGRQEAVAAQAEALYQRLHDQGLAVLYDDRDGSAGVKFHDADLIGIPLRLTVSKRSVGDGLVEAKWRAASDRLKLDDDGLAAELAHLRRGVAPVPARPQSSTGCF